MTITRMKKKYIQPQCKSVVLSLKDSVATDDVNINNQSGDTWTFSNEADFEEEQIAPDKSPWG